MTLHCFEGPLLPYVPCKVSTTSQTTTLPSLPGIAQCGFGGYCEMSPPPWFPCTPLPFLHVFVTHTLDSLHVSPSQPLRLPAMVLCRVRLTVPHSCPHTSRGPLPCVLPSACSLQWPGSAPAVWAHTSYASTVAPRSADVPRLGALQATFSIFHFPLLTPSPSHVHEVLSLHPAVCPFLFPSSPLTIPASHPMNSLVFSLTSASLFTCVHVASFFIPRVLY